MKRKIFILIITHKSIFKVFFKKAFYLRFFLQLFLLFTIVSCNSEKESLEGVNFETAEYYESFLFVPAKSKSSSKMMEIKFNDWAKQKNSYVTLLMCYKIESNKKSFYLGSESSPFISVYLDNKLCQNGKIQFEKESEKISNLRIEFSPEAKEGYYTGFIIVDDAKIDRINNIENISTQSKLFEWSIRYNIVMNPLKLALLWGIAIIFLLLFIWFVFFRNLFYPKMQKGKILINAPYSKSIKIKCGRKLVFTTKSKKQKMLHKIFAGKILYEVNSLWNSEIVFYPKDKRSLRIKTSKDYTVTPFTSIIVRGKSYEIQKGKEIIKISFL